MGVCVGVGVEREVNKFRPTSIDSPRKERDVNVVMMIVRYVCARMQVTFTTRNNRKRQKQDQQNKDKTLYPPENAAAS
jgi:hypothetical protein